MSILVYIENTAGTFKKSAFEVLSYAYAISKQINTTVVALSIGDVREETLLALGQYGADKVLQVNNESLKSFHNQAYTAIIAEAAQQENATLVILSASLTGKGLASRVAAKLEAGLAQNAVELPQLSTNQFTVKRTVFSGKAFAIVELSTPVKVISLAPNHFEIQENEKQVELAHFTGKPNTSDLGVIVREIIQSSQKVPLAEATIVVSGGRGLKGPEHWHLVEDLAAALGGAIACSKPVSDAGWRPHEEHVGQTGTTISPDLYIAIGISGAIQHLAGVSSSKTIVVINKDPEAPFFKAADYGIVGDAFEIVPKLIEAVNTLKEK